MDFNVIINQMIELFLLLFVGYFLAKINLIDTYFNNKLNKFVLNVAIPCLMINSALTITNYKDISIVAYVFIIAIIVYLLLPICGYIIAKILRIKKENIGSYIFMTTFSNIGFIGFPIMKSIFGSEAVFYTTIFNMIFNLAVYTYGLAIINMGKKSYHFHIKSLITPATISCIISLIIYIFRIHLPSVLTNTFRTLGSMTSPLAMIIIGATLSTISIKEVLTEWIIYPYTILKQIILPIIAYYILIIFIKDKLILGVTLINIAMPVGSSIVLFSKMYGGDEKLGAKAIFITTIISIITIPIIVGLYLV